MHCQSDLSVTALTVIAVIIHAYAALHQAYPAHSRALRTEAGHDRQLLQHEAQPGLDACKWDSIAIGPFSVDRQQEAFQSSRRWV